MNPETQHRNQLTPVARQGYPEITLLSIGQTAKLSGVCEADLLGLIEYGVLTPNPAITALENEPNTFDIGCVMKLQRAAMLRQDLALDGHGFALAVMFLNQIMGLEEQLDTTQRDLRDFQTPSMMAQQRG